MPRLALPLLIALLLGEAAHAEPPSRPVAFDAVEAPATITVTSPAVRADGALAAEYSGYGRNIPPAVAWSGAPKTAKAFVLLVQDPDGSRPEPTIHWVAYNIPGNVAELPRRTPNEPRLEKPDGAMQGANDHGGIGWTGPHPPIGGPAHRYHLQVFALDRRLKLKPGATLPDVTTAMKGRVIAKGETVFLFAQPAPTPPKT